MFLPVGKTTLLPTPARCCLALLLTKASKKMSPFPEGLGFSPGEALFSEISASIIVTGGPGQPVPEGRGEESEHSVSHD